MIHGFEKYIKNVESRVRRLEESIISKMVIVANLLQFEEGIGVTDTVIIYTRQSNNTFYIGYSELGIDSIGDMRGPFIEVYSS